MIRIVQILTLTLALTGCALSPQGPAPEERETYLLHEGLYRVALLSLKVLRDTQPSDPAVLSLRSEARAHLIVYSKEVEDLRRQYKWPLLHEDLVEEVRQYLKETETPNTNLEPISGS